MTLLHELIMYEPALIKDYLIYNIRMLDYIFIMNSVNIYKEKEKSDKRFLIYNCDVHSIKMDERTSVHTLKHLQEYYFKQSTH